MSFRVSVHYDRLGEAACQPGRRRLPMARRRELIECKRCLAIFDRMELQRANTPRPRMPKRP